MHLHKHRLITIINQIIDLGMLLLIGGDIQGNPGSLKHILKKLPKEHTQRQKQYSIPNTLRLKPHYLHLEDILPHTSPPTHI
jgi:hypothetical protein